MNFLYNHSIDEIFGEGVLEKLFYDLPFLSVYMNDDDVSTLFIFTNEDINNLKQVNFIKEKRTGKIQLNINFFNEEDFSEMDYYDLFEDEKTIGKQLNYEVSLENLNLLTKNMSTSDINVFAYKIKDIKKFELSFHKWIYENFKEEIKELANDESVFKNEAIKEKTRASIKIIAETALKSGALTYFDMLDPKTLINNPRSLSIQEKEFIDFNKAKNFIPVKITTK